MTDAAILAPVQVRGMGFRDGSEDVRLFKTALLEGRVNPVRSLLLRSAVAETKASTRPSLFNPFNRRNNDVQVFQKPAWP